MKRLIDFVLAAIALILLSPILLGIAVSVWLHDRGPALFRQRRVGLNGRIFELYKFRTMVVDAERRGGYFTLGDDPRITQLGRLLRRTSVDELPQLLNVLRGDMSLVGPRPDVPAQEAQYAADDWSLRHSVRPGLTGLAQATARSTATPDERTAIDLHYVRTATIGLDLRIVLMTVRQVFAGSGN